MSESAADWLAAREAVDARSRSNELATAFAAVVGPDALVDDLDEPIRSRIETHQSADHGFGDSLGPDAGQYLAEKLRAQECQVALRQSDWKLGPADHSLIAMMIGGIARRVASMHDSIDAQEWAKLRRNQVKRGELSLTVKHVDLLSIPQRLELRHT